MDKINAATNDVTQENIEKIIGLFPQVATEIEKDDGAIALSVDFDALRDLLGDVAEGQRERYQFTWPGKREAKAEARRPIDKTMIPCPEKSVDWDTTENLYIEGDNLDALKLLKETYAGKIKVIIIDPPYNTGNDRFLYSDDFAETEGEHDANSGDFDENGIRLVENRDTSGRFHSYWCSEIYKRLICARDLMSSDGAIFICIDDNEFENLKKITDEIFGASNWVGNIIWQHSIQPKGYLDGFSVHHNEILVYRKSPNFKLKPLERTEDDNKAYSNPDNDPRGPWRSGDVRNALYRPNLIYDVISPSGKVIKPCANGWRWSQETMNEKIRTGEIVFSADETRIIRKIYLDTLEGRAPETIWFGKEVGTTREAATELKELLDDAVFDTPKPTKLLMKMLDLIHGNDYCVLDFYGGSSSTANAVMKKNVIDDGKRSFITVQFPDVVDEGSKAQRKGYSTITEIGEDRIRRAGQKICDEIKAENQQLKLGEEPRAIPDIGFRVLRIDSSNFKNTHLMPDQTNQASLLEVIDNVKEGRTSEDILFQVLPAFRIPYSAHIEEQDINGKKVFDVNHGQLLACLDADVTNDVIEEIARRKPSYAVMRDLSFKDDSAAANFEELFKTFSPDTIRRVI